MVVDEWKSVITLAIGAVVACVAGLSPHADPHLMLLAMGIIGGALGISVPGTPRRDAANRTRATDEPEGKPSGR